MKPKNFNNKGKKNSATTMRHDLGSNSGDETKIATMGFKGKDSISSTCSSSSLNGTQHEKQRIDFSHIRVILQYTKIDTLFDSGSEANLILGDVVKKLNLETTPHPKPYTLGWLSENEKFHVTKRCKLRFSITPNFIDEVELDVIPLYICSIVFGSPYLYDRRAIFNRHENKYHLFKYGVDYIVRAHNKKLNLSIVNVGQMKRLINSSKEFVPLIIIHKENVEN